MTFRKFVEELLNDQLENARRLDIEPLLKKEKARTAHCPGCTRMFIKQTNNEVEYCPICAGEE